MFTGIINHLGLFKGHRKGKQEMAIEAASIASQIEIGESLSVNGVCLSLIKKEKDTLFFNLSPETIQRTNLGSLRQGAKLNLELSLTLSSPLSGHLVTGHIDSRGKVSKIMERRSGKRITVSFPPELRKYFILKGSVALNGVSLTIADLGTSSLEVELIPITLENSNLGELKRGNDVNIECDMIGKYVYTWISHMKR
ncbi:MAG: riboflavin synthase [Candidatus Aminicenantes bacterium]|nr:MAG: riboflavin synthase [Candidatus Aminicenantes bacterium]